MLVLRKIAVTGIISSGKSTVCRLLQEYGAYVVDADAVVHRLLSPKTSCGEQVIKLLGPEILTGNQISRKKISNIVFSNPSKLQALEAILHPVVRQEINRLFETVSKNESYRFFVAEVPLLDEAHMRDDFDMVVAVVTDPAIARKRASSTEEFDRRSRFQLSQSTKEAQADYVITNQGDLAALKAEVALLIPKLIKGA